MHSCRQSNEKPFTFLLQWLFWSVAALLCAPLYSQDIVRHAGCALSYIQANSSYSKFAQILYATPYTANLSSEFLQLSLPFGICSPLSATICKHT